MSIPASIKEAMSRDGQARGDHMVLAYGMMAKASAASGDEDERLMADVYNCASRCIANETAMFDRLSAAVVAHFGEAV